MDIAVRAAEHFRRQGPIVVLVLVVLALTSLPILAIYFKLGDAWQGITPSLTDEGVYYAHMHSVGQGYLTDGNPFVFEYRNGTPLVIFGGAWINSLPVLAGLSFNAALALNFVLWSLAYVAVLYWLLREWSVSRWLAVAGTLFLYVQSYTYVLRPVNLQPVYPFYFLFYIALGRLIREQSRANVAFLAASVAISFYVFAYLWQIAVVTLGLLFLYAALRRNLTLVRATVTASLIGGIVGLPMPLYMLWLSHSSPYFWESVGRFGLVYSHLPEAELLYSGGWIGLLLFGLFVLFRTHAGLYADKEFAKLAVFLGVSGLGLWVLQGNSVITGKLIETGMHVRILILPWLWFSTVLVAVHVWTRRASFSRGPLVAIGIVILGCALASGHFLRMNLSPVADLDTKSYRWRSEQEYAKPFQWLDTTESDPVVVWVNPDPADGMASLLPIFTKHFPLYAPAAQQTLMSTNEVHERFLVSQYFNNPTVADLKVRSVMELYVGRDVLPHKSMTIAREVKVCNALRRLFIYMACGVPLTPEELLGEKFFTDMVTKFESDIHPNISQYLKKYNVSYIIKDKRSDSRYRPERLGGVQVYEDERYEIYRLP